MTDKNRTDATAPLFEAPWHTAAAITKGLGSRIANATLAAMGSGKALGRLDLRQTTDKLMAQYQQFLGRNPGTEMSLESLERFLTAAHGAKYATIAMNAFTGGAAASPSAAPATATTSASASAASAAPPPPSSPSPAPAAARPVDPVDRERGFYAGLSKARPDALSHMPAASARKLATPAPGATHSDYQNQTMSQIMQKVRQPVPDLRQITALTNELIAHARDYGGRDQQRVAMFLRKMKQDPNVAKNPRLLRYMSGMRLESVQRAIDAALFLVECNITRRMSLNEMRYIVLREDTALNRLQVDKILRAVATDMLNNGNVNFISKNTGSRRGWQSDEPSDEPSGVQNNTATTSQSTPQRTSAATSAPASPTAAPQRRPLGSSSVVDPTALQRSLLQHGVRDPLANNLINAAQKYQTVDKILAAFKGQQLPAEATSALFQAAH